MKTLLHTCARCAHKALACILAFCMVNLPVWALNASDATVTGGTANVTSPTMNTVSVDLITNRAVLDWTQMNATNSETLNFSGAAGFAVLNRVASAVDFNGTLNGAGGRIYVISPNGVLLGPDARITANAFTAAGLNISNTDFMNGSNNFQPFAGGIVGNVTNYGMITGVGVDSQVNLIGQTVINEGVISLPSGGVAVMAAGKNVYLGAPGKKVIVEMTGVEDGLVENNGTITAPNGKIILAAGDIYSIPLHPQLKVNTGTVAVPVYNEDNQPSIVETGSGTVRQSGTISANGANGEVVLTAGDVVEFTSDSVTNSIGGDVTAYAHDFAGTGAATYFNNGAAVNIGNGEATFHGNHVVYAGSVSGQFGGTIHYNSQNLTIADVMPGSGPVLDTLYEEMIEYFSNRGINLDLAADNQITVGYMADTKILGGSGDITLRTVYDDGGILFQTDSFGRRTILQTTANFEKGGGDIFMIAGAGGIVAGDLLTNTLSSDKVSNPGRIRIMTTNGGDITVGDMYAVRGGITEISAIASGDLTVNGSVISQNHTVPKDEKEVGFARICLVATEDILINGQDGSITVDAHGKYETTADIIICAGEDVTIRDLDGGINAYAQTSENSSRLITADAHIDISAGGTKNSPAFISINGETYTPTGNNSDLPITLETKVSGTAPMAVDAGDSSSAGAPGERTWTKNKSVAGDYEMSIKLRMNNNEQVAPGELGSPCYDCPTPEGLPPVPHIFWIMDDAAQMSWSATDVYLDILENDDNGNPLDGFVSFNSAAGGTLTPIYEDGKITGFQYTPPQGATFVWDGVSDYASFTDTFTYKATDAQGNVSLNTATVTLTVTNYLPVVTNADGTVHMSTPTTPTGVDVPLIITDIDGSPNPLNVTVGNATNGSASVNGTTATYQPDNYYAGSDSFGYDVSDGSIIMQNEQPAVVNGTVNIQVTNELPVANDGSASGHMNLDLGGSASFADTPDSLAGGAIDPLTVQVLTQPQHGTVTFNSETGQFTYTPNGDGYVGTDSFTYSVSDGQQGAAPSVGTINLTLTNERPVANDGSASGHMNIALDGTVTFNDMPDVSANNEIDPLTVQVLTQPQHGTVAFNTETGQFTYTPNGDGYVGTDSFTYSVSDGEMGAAPSVGTINLNLTNEGPVAQDSSSTGHWNIALDGTMTYYDQPDINANNEVDPLNIQIINQPQHGTITYNAETGQFTYTPAAGSDYVGPDSFTYSVSDGQQGVQPVVGTVQLTLTNVGPSANNDSGSTQQGVPVTINIQINDNDVFDTVNGTANPGFKDAPLTIKSIFNVIGGTAVLNPDGTVTFTPDPDFTGTASFEYTLTDGAVDYNGKTPVPFVDGAVVQIEVTADTPEPVIPLPPLAELRVPELKGCPALMDAAAAELAINSDELQVMLNNAMASNPNLQPCDACERLVDASGALKDVDGQRMAALSQVFGTIAPADAPFTPEMSASVATAFADMSSADPRYALANEYVDSFVAYVATLQRDLKLPVGDPVALVMEKYGQALNDSGNPNIAAYIMAQVNAEGTGQSL